MFQLRNSLLKNKPVLTDSEKIQNTEKQIFFNLILIKQYEVKI